MLVTDSGWNDGSSELRAKLAHTYASIRANAIAACEARCAEEMEAAADGPGWLVIQELPPDLWARLRVIVRQALKHSVTTMDKELRGYGCGPAFNCSPTLQCLQTIVLQCEHRSVPHKLSSDFM